MRESISFSHISRLLRLNSEMDLAAQRGRINEPFLERSLDTLDGLVHLPRFLHWLTLARLSELALWCAGNYADSGWFTATGDLMFNPRRKFLTRKNSSELIELDRHKPISEQAGCRGLDRGSMIHRLKNEFRLVVEKKALIPELCQRLKQHSIPSPPYLKQVESRMTRISSTLSFQSTINLPQGMDLESYVRLLDERERENLESNLCRFDLSLFHQFGEWIETNMGHHGLETMELLAGAGKARQQAA